MKPPYSLSDSELMQYADEHLQYEIDMLTWSAGILAFLAAKKAGGYLSWTINNGLLNTYSLHARNLINFLYSRSKGKDYPTDIILEDYVDATVIASSLPSITLRLEKALIKANKQVAHLSMDRIQYEQLGKEWMFIELSKEILLAFAAIVSHIPSSRISDSLRRKLTQLDFRIPIVDIETRKSESGVPDSITFSLRLSGDGKEIKGISV